VGRSCFWTRMNADLRGFFGEMKISVGQRGSVGYLEFARSLQRLAGARSLVIRE